MFHGILVLIARALSGETGDFAGAFVYTYILGMLPAAEGIGETTHMRRFARAF